VLNIGAYRFNKMFISSLFLLGVVLLFMFIPIHVVSQKIESTEILSLDFSNEEEVLKHLDTTTENCDAGNDGTSREYVDTTNEWFVFEGDNTNTSNGYDEPIVVVKGYCESDSFNSYAVLPYNYSVSAEFMVPSSPGYGDFYIFPRYKTVEDKYEVVVDTEYSNLVFNYVKNNEWHELKIVSLGFNIQKDHWYRLEVSITWEYNSEQGKYMNHIVATVTDLSNQNNKYTGEIWDDNLPPDTYNGLGFLGFDDDKQFKVYMDNIEVRTSMEKAFEEPTESISLGDLDVVSLYITHDNNMLFFHLYLNDKVQADTSYTKYWVIQLDIDKDSRNSDSGFNYDYYFVIQLSTDASATANLFDSSGSWIKALHILGGGIGYNYIIVEVPRNSLTGLQDSFYAYGYTELGSTAKDGFPRDDVDTASGDYVIYYLSKPKPTSSWTIETDDQGDASPLSLDIVSIGSAYNDELLFFNITVAGQYAWNGGSDTGIYRIYIDADNNPETGYQVGSIGADYMLEHVVGYSPKLWKYTGSGTSWSWSFIKREDYLFNPGGLSSSIYVVPKNDFTDPPLGSQIKIYAQTGQGSNSVDDTGALPIPVPESILIVLIGVLLGLGIIMYRNIQMR